jgi:hypothetical protein
VVSLYHVPLRKGRVQSQVCLPMVDNLYDFAYNIWDKIRFFFPAVARAVPPNTCSMLYYHSLFKGTMSKHRDLNLIPKEANGHQKIFRGSSIMSVSLFAPMHYAIWGLDKEDMNPYECAAEKNYTNNIESHLLDSGSILIWHPRDDERYMHSLEFPPEVTKHKTKTFCRLPYVWRWVHGNGTYHISGNNDVNLVPDDALLHTRWDENLTMGSNNETST